MHALVIEDEALIAMAIEDVLRDCGFSSFDVAVCSADAIAFAERTCPDLITADVELNPGSGIKAVNAICSGQCIPVVFITGTPSKVTSQMPDYPLILKPFAAEILATAVRAALAEGRSEAIANPTSRRQINSRSEK